MIKKNIELFSKYWYYLLIFLILIIICLFLILNSKSKVEPNQVTKYDNKIVLFGEKSISIKQGEEYIEPGFYALIDGKIIQDEVIVDNNIDTTKPGIYYITYSYNKISIKRKVEVVKEEKVYLYLNGEKKVTIYVGDTYNDLGAFAYNDKKEDISGNIIVTNNVNTSIPGTYQVKYTLKYNDKQEVLVREVVVEKSIRNELEINLEYDNKTLTNSFVEVKINVSGSNYQYTKLPNGNISNNMIDTYKITNNGVYYFYFYDTSNNYKVESVNINNIDKISPDGACVANVEDNKTNIQVISYDDSGISRYVYNNYYSSTSSNYVINQKLSSVNVLIYDVAGNSKNISCQVNEIKDDYIEMHFIAGVSDDDAILIRTREKTIMIDGGRYEAKKKIIPYLKEIGVTKIDALIGSHVHWNHVQSHAAILDEFLVDKVYYSVDPLNCTSKKQCKSDDVMYLKKKLQEKNITPNILKATDTLKVGDMSLYFIGPTRGVLTTYQNANSLVFILKYGSNKYMFTGDTPGKYMNTTKFTNNIKNFNMNLHVDVLKWPHHGYEDLTDEFFAATTPKYAIIPNCCWCTSKYPSSKNKNLMKKYNTSYYQVCEYKNIVLTSNGKDIKINTNQDPVNWKW